MDLTDINWYEKETPFFVFDLDRIKTKIQNIKDTINPDKIFYAIKSNSLPQVLETISSQGCGFEVNNEGELEKATKGELINSSPITSANDVQALYRQGVNDFCVDTKTQVDNLSYNAPGANVFVRIYNDNENSRFKLNRLGIHSKDAPELINYAESQGLNPVGITFHVGSQCSNVNNWNEAIYQSSILFQHFPHLEKLNIGGGLPIQYANEVVELQEIAKEINSSIDKYFSQRPELIIEPGRYLVGDCASTWTSVTQVDERKDFSRAIVDISLFSGLIEILEIRNGFRYPLRTDSDGEKQKYQIEGCTCAGTDIIVPDAVLPRLHVDYRNPKNSSKLIFENTGAYTLEYLGKNGNHGFNGARTPQVYFIQGGQLL